MDESSPDLSCMPKLIEMKSAATVSELLSPPISEDLTLAAQQQIFAIQDMEREIQTLERDIRQQKESSVNAKTAITFDQLKKIHNIGRALGPQKEAFFDRICRAADIQRASLKNRLKQNKEKFEPNCSVLSSPLIDSAGNTMDGGSYLVPTTLQSLILLNQKPDVNQLRSPMDVSPSPLILVEEDVRIPAERQFDLLHLGFSYDEVHQVSEIFDRFKEEYKGVTKASSVELNQVLPQFSNFISTNAPESLKLISHCFNLLELGYSRKEVQRTLVREKRKISQEIEDELKVKRNCLSPLNGQSASPPMEDIGSDDAREENHNLLNILNREANNT